MSQQAPTAREAAGLTVACPACAAKVDMWCYHQYVSPTDFVLSHTIHPVRSELGLAYEVEQAKQQLTTTREQAEPLLRFVSARLSERRSAGIAEEAPLLDVIERCHELYAATFRVPEDYYTMLPVLTAVAVAYRAALLASVQHWSNHSEFKSTWVLEPLDT